MDDISIKVVTDKHKDVKVVKASERTLVGLYHKNDCLVTMDLATYKKEVHINVYDQDNILRHRSVFKVRGVK